MVVVVAVVHCATLYVIASEVITMRCNRNFIIIIIITPCPQEVSQKFFLLQLKKLPTEFHQI